MDIEIMLKSFFQQILYGLDLITIVKIFPSNLYLKTQIT